MKAMSRAARRTLALLWLIAGAAPARSELVLTELIVDLQPGKHGREDVEVWNKSPERSFVAIEPREIVDPSLPSQHVRVEPDPEKLGLLVSPSRLILEPGQRRLIRIGTLSSDVDHEHVYRVTVKPVAGAVQSAASGLKIMVGYDILVLVRPMSLQQRISAVRKGRQLTFKNDGNVSVEIIQGRQCNGVHEACVELPGKRLYVGGTWSVQLPSDGPAQFLLKGPERALPATY